MSKIPVAVILTDTHLKEDNIDVNLSVYNQTIQFCIDNNIKTIIHAGDIFHSRKSQSQSVLITFDKILDQILENDLKMISIVGNHDKTDYDSSESFLTPFLYHPCLQLIETSWIDKENSLKLNENIRFSFISYFSDDIYIKELMSLNSQLNQENENFLLTHIGVNGAVMNNGTKIESSIKTSLFKSFKQVYIGHYHDGQSWSNINYIGASIQHNFGERRNKGLQVLYNDGSLEFVQLDFPEYIKFQVNVKDLTTKDIEELEDIKKNSKDNIKIVLIGNKKDVNEFNVQEIKKIGVEVELKQEDVEIKELDQRIEPFTAKTLTDQFEIFCEKNQLDKEMGLKYFNEIVK